MPTNPYQTPAQLDEQPSATKSVAGPAISLLVVGIVCIAIAAFGIGIDVFLLLSGVAALITERTGDSQETDIAVRIAWSLLLIVASSFVIYGSLKMRRLESYSMAFAGAVVAAIPCVGPCCLLGIPFGIWAIVVLRRPEVRSAFRS